MDQQLHIKHCPICNHDLPVDSFGICRARKDGHNLYCMSCIREKVRRSRRALKEYKDRRKCYRTEMIEIVEFESHYGRDYIPKSAQKQAPVERVRDAIRNGAQTQREIGQETRLGKDEIGDALTTLLLWNKEIRTEVSGNTRLYFTVEETPEPLPDRKPVVLAPFHEIDLFMPGRRKAVG